MTMVVSEEEYQESTALARREDRAPAVDHQAGIVALASMDEGDFERRLALLGVGRQRVERIHRELMVQGVDYGTIPGTRNATLLKPGAERLCQFYGWVQEFVHQRTLGDQHSAPAISYVTECRLHLGTLEGPVVSTANGACNTWERKYRYRRGERTCPSCGAEGSIRRSKQEYGGGWYCERRSGCGANFDAGDPAIEQQHLGDVENPDPHDLDNTVMKMAEKRAMIAAVLRATATSGRYQDNGDEGEGERAAPAPEARSTGRGRGRAAAEPAVGCSACGVDVTPAAQTLSKQKFGRVLCPGCQKTARPAEAEASRQVDAEPAGDDLQMTGQERAAAAVRSAETGGTYAQQQGL